jgi:[protein-PII] uridylyltransferase
MNTLSKHNIIELACSSRGPNTYLLKVTVSENEIGIIYRVTAVLFAHGWNILEANVETVGDGLVKDVFLIDNIHSVKMTQEALNEIHSDLELLFYKRVSVLNYLNKVPHCPSDSNHEAMIYIFNPQYVDSTVLDIHTLDRPGLLFQISQVLYLFGIDILSVTAKSEDGQIRDSFLIRMQDGGRLDEETSQKVRKSLLSVL